MIDYMHSKGIRLGLSINPMEGIYPYEDYYSKIKEYITPNADGVIPFDILNPKLLDAYLKLLIHPLDNLGVDFFWIDYNNENDKFKLWALNHYHHLDMKRDYKRRPMVLARNSNIAPHRYPVS
jgi:alpha-glucosidase (family GH31 glycosyl hydrolase)